jgi:hypothetical protein
MVKRHHSKELDERKREVKQMKKYLFCALALAVMIFTPMSGGGWGIIGF